MGAYYKKEEAIASSYIIRAMCYTLLFESMLK